MPTKIGLHALHVNLYLLEYFEPILFFDPHRLFYDPKGKFGQNLKSSNISEIGEAAPTKIGLHVFDVTLYLHRFFEPINSIFCYHGL